MLGRHGLPGREREDASGQSWAPSLKRPGQVGPCTPHDILLYVFCAFCVHNGPWRCGERMSTPQYAAFREWVERPCPEGEWVYRGQAARFPAIVPSLLRGSNRGFYRNRLFDFDYQIAQTLLSNSAVFGRDRLLAETIDDPAGRGFEELAYSVLGGPPVTDPRLGMVEIVRALAQHYDYPTLFVDVSLQATVSAMFATHYLHDRAWAVSDERGMLFRWPARRLSKYRLQIPAQVEVDGEWFDDVPVIDISAINPHMRRPRNQFGALAKPSYDPRPVFQPHHSAVSRLITIDMAALPTTETFELTPELAREIEARESVTMSTLFPDQIDLGFSYMAVIALLSLATHHFSDEEMELLGNPEGAAMVNASHRKALRVGSFVLDRECLRLVRGCPVPASLHEFGPREAAGFIEGCVKTARAAVPLMGTDQEAIERWKQHQELVWQTETDRRYQSWRNAAIEVVGLDAVPPESPAAPPIVLGPSDWVGPELERRYQTVTRILDTMEYLPIYACDEPERFANLVETLPSSPRYESMVRDLVRHQRSWLPNDEVFPLSTETMP